LFLGGFDLTPTFREVNKKYSTRYYLSLVLIDEGMLLLVPIAIITCSHYTANASTDARRYFKQSEIVLFRQAPEGLTLAQEQNKLMAVS
jgi:vacuolar protein sorting-associated protein 26